jgi:hypothetical protein
MLRTTTYSRYKGVVAASAGSQLQHAKDLVASFDMPATRTVRGVFRKRTSIWSLAHPDELAHSKTVAVGDEDERRIPRAVSADRASRLDKLSTSCGVRCSSVRRSRFAPRVVE